MIRVDRLGTTDYPDALARMRAHVERRADGHREMADELWLTEHPPVFTLGFASRPEHLRAVGDIPVVATERGGQVTYHGPGQTIAYLLLDLRRRKFGVRELVCRIERGIIDCLAGYGIEGVRKPGAPGIYVPAHGRQLAQVLAQGVAQPPDATTPAATAAATAAAAPPAEFTAEAPMAKIASIGLKVSRGLTWHGVAVNGRMDLEPFGRIDPCGYPGLEMTDIATQASAHMQTMIGQLPDRLAASLIAAIDAK